MNYQFYKETNFKKIVLNDEVIRIPRDWMVVKLRHFITLSFPITKSSIKNMEKDKVYYIPMEKIPENGVYCDYVITRKEELKTSSVTFPGSLLLAKITPSFENGKQGIVPFELKDGVIFTTTEVFSIKPIGEYLDLFFLFYYLKFSKIRKFLEKRMKGTTGRKRVDKEALLNLDLILPPLQEQQAIASILQKFDQLLEIYNQEINTLQRIKKALMKKFFTEGVFKHEKFKEVILNDEIIKIPEEWEVKKLKEVVKTIKSGGTPSTKKSEFWNGNIPFVKIEDISGENKYLFNTKNFITEKGLKSSNAWLVPVNSLLLAMYGSIGEVAINKIKVATNQAILGIIPNFKLNVEFLYYLFKYFKKELVKKGGETTQRNINAQIVKEFEIFLPSLEEQKEIAEKLSKIDELIELKKEKKEQVQKFKKVMMKKLLTGEVRIKIN